ncbi:MAG: hypothetical protein JWO36_512 [Myxococcales bacterium]|nr:hypothetical protein [Myxococcales bacterium]
MRELSVQRTGDTYVLRDGDTVVWTIELPLDMSGTPFREEVVWSASGVVAIGGGTTIYFVGIELGTVTRRISLARDLFGHFEIDRDVLYVSGFRDVTAIDRQLSILWSSKNVAIDGIVWQSREGDRIKLSAEMDPPGGWVDVELDAATGRRLS